MTGLYKSFASRSIRVGSPSVFGGFSTETPLVEVTDVGSVELPSSNEWDEGTGTVYLEDGNGNKSAVAWSPDGYVAVKNGTTLDQYPPLWDDPAHSATRTYYVKNGGSDGAAGTSDATAWATLSKLNGFAAQAGDSFLLKEGDTWNETLTPPASGSAGDTIKYGSYNTGTPGAKPIIDGQLTRTYTLLSSGKSNLWFDNIDFRRGKTVTVGTDASYTGQCDVGENVTNITLTDCVIREATGSGFSARDGCTNIRQKDCVIHSNKGYGSTVRSNTALSTGHVVAFCEFYNNNEYSGGSTGTEPLTGYTSDSQIYGCYIHDNNNTDTLIYRAWGEYESDDYLGAVRIFNNIVQSPPAHKSFGSIELKGKGGRAYRNKVVTCGAYAIECTFPNNVGGSTPYIAAYVHHNVCYDGGYLGWGGSAIHIHNMDYPLAAGEGEMLAWNNTTDSFESGMGVGTQNMSATGNTFKIKNNISSNMSDWGTKIAIVVDTIEVDYNFYYNVQNNFRRSTGYTFANWQTNFSYDTNGSHGTDPQFIDATNSTLLSRDYSLSPGSAARSAGTDVVYKMDDPNSWIGINYIPHATSPDCGAYQYLAGKTMDFSKWLIGLQCNAGTAQVFKLWRDADTEANLLSMTT